MSFLDKFFKSKQKTPAEQAKERLLRIVVESRGMRGAPDFVPRMKEEILQVHQDILKHDYLHIVKHVSLKIGKIL